MTLLSKTREINAMLQESAGKPVNFKEMAEKLSSVIECNAFIVSRKGKLLGLRNSPPNRKRTYEKNVRRS